MGKWRIICRTSSFVVDQTNDRQTNHCDQRKKTNDNPLCPR